MKLKTLVGVCTLAVTTLLVGAPGRVLAQAAPPAPPIPAGGIGQMLAGGLSSMDTSRMDPTRSVVGFLLKRDDVRTAIRLEQRQREKLDDIDKQQVQSQQKFMMDMLQKAQAAFGGGQNVTPEEQQAKIQELKTTAETTLQNIQKDQNKSLAEILKPEQLARLRELDLQWRGPMAMGDPKMEESMGLTKPEVAVIDAALTEFRSVVRTSFQRMMPAGIGGRRGANGANATPANGVNAQNNPRTVPSSDATTQQSDAQKELEKARAIAGDKILKGFTDAHKQKWETLQGKPFKFRTYN